MYMLSTLSSIDDRSIRAYVVLTVQMDTRYFGCKTLNLKKIKASIMQNASSLPCWNTCISQMQHVLPYHFASTSLSPCTNVADSCSSIKTQLGHHIFQASFLNILLSNPASQLWLFFLCAFVYLKTLSSSIEFTA